MKPGLPQKIRCMSFFNLLIRQPTDAGQASAVNIFWLPTAHCQLLLPLAPSPPSRTWRTTNPFHFLIFPRMKKPAIYRSKPSSRSSLPRAPSPAEGGVTQCSGARKLNTTPTVLSSGNTPQKTEFCIDFVQFCAYRSPLMAHGSLPPDISGELLSQE